MATNRKMYIAISGLIGAGKTTLAKKLQQEIEGSVVHFEEVEENPFLGKFYLNPHKFSFKLQLYLLNRRLREQLKISDKLKRGESRVVIQDRSIYEDSMFVNVLSESGLLDVEETKLYHDMFGTISDNILPHPDVLIHLNVTPETALKRIQKRDRKCEREITLEYLTQLHFQYERFVEMVVPKIPQVIVLDWNKEDLPLDDFLINLK